MAETIAALATPMGKSGIGVVRLSGERALEITGRLAADPSFSPEPRSARLVRLSDPLTGETLDETIITYFKKPNSFTGEDVVEISCHGSPVLLRQVIDACLSLGARLAGPGEFTLRAVANGRIDLSEAEAIRDLIDAQTTAASRQAVRQMSGELSRQLQPLKDDLLNIIVVLESALEFVEDDLPPEQLAGVRGKLALAANETRRLADTFKAGHLIRDGLRVALVGRPNVGKSSLFNALLGSERAIVTEVAGTTRDHLHERFVVGGIPISLIDTAGLRHTTDTVESIGVERARGVMADADVVVIMINVSGEVTAEDREIIASIEQGTFIIALNKIDKIAPDVALDPGMLASGVKSYPISAKTGEGLDRLRQAMIEPFGVHDIGAAGFMITDARHHDLLRRAGSEIDDSIERLAQKCSEEIVLVGLHNALRYLGEITGETTTEEMLSRIFSTFCIGK